MPIHTFQPSYFHNFDNHCRSTDSREQQTEKGQGPFSPSVLFGHHKKVRTKLPSLSPVTPNVHHHHHHHHHLSSATAPPHFLVSRMRHERLPPPSTPTNPRCPHCHSDFLEQMDSFTPTLLPQFPNNRNPSSDTFTPSDDNFLLNSPYLHRLIHHLTTTNDAPTANPHHNSASRSAVAALEVLQISSSMLENDPVIPCAVCKDHFLLDMQVKMLPCKHMYHSDCILPWLEMNNSCPVCRFRLPTEEDEVCRRRQNFVAATRLEELLGEQEDLFGFRRTLRRLARRHQLDREDTTRGDSLEFLLSSTQIGQAGQGVGVVARANSVETVSSWPNWPLESGSEDEVGGSGNRLGG